MKLNRGIVFALSVIAVLGFGVISNGALYPKDKRQWSSTGRMMVARQGACAVGFEDGRVLITGGSNATGVTATAEFLGVNGGAAPAASMSFPRTGHMCVPLNDGTVLVAGGRTTGDAVTASAELFDPIANTWRSIDWMASARVGATASVLDDGRVLIAGGESGSVPLASLEIFDPATASFSTLSATLSSPRTQHAATLLKDGRVVIAGGYDGSAPSDAIEIFEPSTGAVALLARMSSPRAGLSATTLLDGRVYLAGGNDGRADLASTEILDPATGALIAAANMDTPRRDHIAFRVPHNNAVIIIGGTSDAQSLASAGLYIPWRNTYEPTGLAAGGLAGAAASVIGESGMIRVAGGSLRSMSESSTSALTLPTIMTDKLDYAPGESVTISGANWTPGNTVDLLVKILPEGTVTRWEGTAVVNADGTILLENAFQMTRDDAYQSFSLTATEQGTGLTAQEWLFTDGPKVGSASVGTQSPISVTAGNSATYTVTVNRGSGSDGSGNFTADLSVTTALPAGASASFSPNPVTLAPGINSASATLTITTTGATPAGTTPFTVRAARTAADFAEGSGTLVVQSGLSQSITVTTPAPASAAYNSSFSVAATASSGLPVAITTSGSCSGSGSGSANITMTSSTGTCTVHYNQAGNATYNPAPEITSSTSAAKADQAPLSITGPAEITYGTTGTATTTGGSGTGLVTFSTGASTGCSVSGTTVSVTNASGTCSLTATKAADADYNEATSAAFPVTLHKANQAALTVTGPSDITYGNTGTAAATGGSGTGALTFSSGASTGCSVGGTTVSVSDASGTCALTATKAADDNYNEATSVAFTVNLHKAAQAALNVTGPTEVTYGTTGTATATGGTGTGALTFSAGTSTGCAVVGTTVSVTNASGTCALTATKAADNNYLEITSPSFGVTLHKANQSAVTVTGPSEVTFGIPGTATATGGDGTGSYVFSAGASTGCSVVGTTVTVINASSTCTLTATRNGDNNYNPSAQSAPFNVTLHKATQAINVTTAAPPSAVYNTSFSVAATGGASGNAVLITTSGVCSGSGSGSANITMTSGTGTCTVHYNQAGNDNYEAALEVTSSTTAQKADPVITWSNPADIVYNAALSGTQLNATADVPGTFVYIPPAPTVLNAGENQPLQANFTPTATDNYNTATKTVHINVLKSDTATTLISSPNPSVYGQSVSFTATVTAVAPGGGTPTGTVEFKEGSMVLGSAALVSGSATLNLTSLNASTHTITAHYLESTNYKPSTSNSVSQVVNKASTATTVLSNLNPSIFGTLVTFTATVTPIAPGGGIPDGTVTFTDTSTLTVLCSNVPLNGSGAGACQTAALAFGSHTISAAYTPGVSNNYLGSSGSVVQLVDKATVSATVTVNPATQQYSDKVTFTVVVPGTSINGQTAVNAGATAYFAVGTLGLANCTLAYDGTNFTCTTDATALLETLGANQVSPGAKTVSVTFSAVNPNFIINNTTTTLTITKEDARVTFTGSSFFSTISPSSGQATITLSATVQDISATPDAAGDTDAGDIRNARVSFINRDGSPSVPAGCTNLTPALVSPGDTKTGTVSCTWNVDIASADSVSLTIGTQVNNYYDRNTTADDEVITISKPIGTFFITGGGYLVITNSAGQYAGTEGKKNNFGFNVKYNKSGKSLQGNLNTIIRSNGRVYQIKANSMQSLTVQQGGSSGCPNNASAASPCTAVFISKANLTDITDPLNKIALGGNLTVQVNLTDKGEPGVADSIAITLWNGNQLLYSSKWSGTATVEQIIQGGNLVAH